MSIVNHYLRRLRNEDGHVGILVALFIFVMIGSLMMTWNTAQLSKEKMRLQAAADSAALSYCVWQARGMNAVQNMNDEMYICLSVASDLYLVSIPIQFVGCIFWQGRDIPLIGPICKAVSFIMHGFAAIPGLIAAWLTNGLCPLVIAPIQGFYASCSSALGLWGAQQLAAQNGADRLPYTAPSLSSQGLSSFFDSYFGGTSLWASGGLYAMGYAADFKETYKLPLVKRTMVQAVLDKVTVDEEGNVGQINRTGICSKDADGLVPPWKTGSLFDWIPDPSTAGFPKTLSKVLSKIMSLVDMVVEQVVPKLYQEESMTGLSMLHKLFKTGETWSISPTVSPPWGETDVDKKQLPQPVIFVARRSAGRIETMSLEAWTGSKVSRPGKDLDMVAVAAAQCITGDIVEHSPVASGSRTTAPADCHRPGGFGAGATAKLVPIKAFVEAAAPGRKADLLKGIFH